MTKITLRIGDMWNDAHGRYEDTPILTNKTDLMKAYNKDVEIIGFNLIESCCIDYDNTKLTEDQIRMLTESGMECNKYGITTDSLRYLGREEYVGLFIYFCEKGDPELEIEGTSTDAYLEIGGFSLFN